MAQRMDQALLIESVRVWRAHDCSVTLAAASLDLARTTFQARLNDARVRGIEGAVADPVSTWESREAWTFTKELAGDIDTGVVISASDAHIWPGRETLAYRALIEVTKDIGRHVKLLDSNGDWLDGARTNRHPPHGWNWRPSAVEELECVSAHLHKWAAACGRSKPRRVYKVGNHELNFERRLVMQAKEYEGMKGLRLEDHFPQWELAWSLMLNRSTGHQTMLKHRNAGGIHAGYNNTVKAGVTTVTGHTHILEVKPHADYRGRRYGIQSGCLADPHGPQFEYAENSPGPMCAGFVVLTYKDGRLLPPELCEVIEGRAYFRGQVVVEDHSYAAQAA